MTATGARARRLERPLLYWSVPVIAVVAITITVVVVRHAGEPDTLPAKVGRLMLDAANGSCLGGEASRTRVSASDRPDLYPDLLPYARSAETVSCDDAGPVSVVVEFGSRGELEQAFASSRSARKSAWCFIGKGAFDDPGAFDGPGLSDLRWLCRPLRGTIRPRHVQR